MPNKYLLNYGFVVGQDTPLRRRLCTCIAQVRAEVLAEDAGTALHSSRVTWAGKCATPALALAMADRMVLDALADGVIFGDPDQLADADPDGRIYWIVTHLIADAGKLAAYNA